MDKVIDFFREIVQNRLALIVIVIICVMGLLAQHVAKTNAAFNHAYLVYAAAADDADTAAYAPTAVNNPTRQEINLLLIQVLQNKMTDAERLTKAKRGLVLTLQAKSELDGMTPRIDSVSTALALMVLNVNTADTLFQSSDRQKIVALAQDRLAAVKDIQALSYRANFETQKIFQHLVDSKGQLSNSFVTDLNNEVPASQDDFDRRQSRYQDLQRDFDQIQLLYKHYTSLTAGIK